MSTSLIAGTQIIFFQPHSTSAAVVNPSKPQPENELHQTHDDIKSKSTHNHRDNEVLKHNCYDCENISRFVCFASTFALGFWWMMPPFVRCRVPPFPFPFEHLNDKNLTSNCCVCHIFFTWQPCWVGKLFAVPVLPFSFFHDWWSNSIQSSFSSDNPPHFFQNWCPKCPQKIKWHLGFPSTLKPHLIQRFLASITPPPATPPAPFPNIPMTSRATPPQKEEGTASEEAMDMNSLEFTRNRSVFAINIHRRNGLLWPHWIHSQSMLSNSSNISMM